MAKKEEIKVVKRTKVEKEMTLLQAIEHVVEVSKDSKLKAEAKAEMANEVRYIARRYGITERQAISKFPFMYLAASSELIGNFCDSAIFLSLRSVASLWNWFK